MNDVSREKRWQDHLPRLFPRYALLACLALVVVSLGVALTPARAPEPAEPSSSEQARVAALTETLQLLAAGRHLGTAAQEASEPPRTSSARGSAPAGSPAVEHTVTLLTTQAQALLAPGESASEASDAPPAESGASTPATPATAANTATAAPTPAGTPAARLPATVPALVTALADSGRQRLADAAAADGGMARLLAAVGTGQLLRASALASETGTAAPPRADVAFPKLSGTCPSESTQARSSQPGSAQPGSAQATTGPAESASGDAAAPDNAPAAGTQGVPATHPAGVSAEAALAAVIQTEAEAVYGYQVALPRVGGAAAKSAAEALARHEVLLSGAESLSRRLCFAVRPREAGYALGQSFLASPAAGLGRLEAAGLPAYGDLVALGEGETRQWAIAALYDAGKRSVLWGADPGALPGLDGASLPSPAPLPSD
ncbi:DUF4439 domain-containing protein [Arthrobacter sp. ov118]|uniref:DUF4439 domain-containing protein n=1 Tax=Arthrobacter sp. ov118 TaxID=1761747 RepID=UPI0008E49A73|nr:DUF4439 domain-containing protein [Arthrobacter sp. ov118]SFU05779.1 protein of unknown function [Arthrobacter sp. ov118]